MSLLDNSKLLKWLKNNIFIVEKPSHNTDKIPSNILVNKYNEQINIEDICDMIKDRFGSGISMGLVMGFLVNEAHERKNKKRNS